MPKRLSTTSSALLRTGEQRRFHLVELRRVGVPEQRLGNRHHGLVGRLPRRNHEAVLVHVAGGAVDREAQAARLLGGAAQRDGRHHLLVRHVGRELDAGEVVDVARLDRHALPDAAHRAIPALLPVRNLGERKLGRRVLVVARIDHPHEQLVGRARAQRVGDVELERQVAAFVLTHTAAVEPHRGVVVHGAELEPLHRRARGAALDGGHGELQAIPGGAAVAAKVVELGLPGPRNADGARAVVGPATGLHVVVGVGHELPDPIERETSANHVGFAPLLLLGPPGRSPDGSAHRSPPTRGDPRTFGK
jgi:hypothetical protein